LPSSEPPDLFFEVIAWGEAEFASPHLLSLAQLPAAPGSYVLRFWLPEPVSLAVGRLGVFDFPAGQYLYAGSARGPGGLRARLAHHARPSPHPHWHIDWLKPYARLLGGWVLAHAAQVSPPYECAWAQAIAKLPGARIAAPGFGSADCASRCTAHLVWLSPDFPSAHLLPLFGN
jgi:Uri superfamily endonuclease